MTSLERVLKNDTTDEENASSRKRKDVIVRGVLSVTVISAEEIPIQDMMGKADPYVVLSMKKSGAKSKTRVRSSLIQRGLLMFHPLLCLTNCNFLVSPGCE